VALLERFKRFSTAQMVDAFARAGNGLGDDGLVKLVDFFQGMIDDPGYQRGMEFAKGLIQNGHGSARAARRLVDELSPTVRRKVIENFFVGQIFAGYKKRYAFWEEHGFGPPNAIVISPTMRCNIRCEGCYAGAYTREEELPFEEVDRIVSEAKAMGTNFVFIAGGEPFVIWDDLRKLLARHSDVAFQIYTNGQLVDAAVAKELGRLGNAGLGISIEGTRESTDARRGDGVHGRILETMEHLRREGVLFGFSITATSRNFEDALADSFVEDMIARGCLYGWFFTYIPIGSKPDPELMLSPEQRGMIRDRVVDLRQRYPLFLIDFWNDAMVTSGCIAGGRKYLHVNHRGDVEPCVFAHFAVDNIRGRSLTEVLKSPYFKEIRGRIPHSENLLRPCMIIDHPQVLRDLVARHGARPTHPGADSLLGDLAPHIDAYASDYARVADAKWGAGPCG